MNHGQVSGFDTTGYALAASLPYNRCLPENFRAPLSTLTDGKSFTLLHPVYLTSIILGKRHIEGNAYMGQIQSRETCAEES